MASAPRSVYDPDMTNLRRMAGGTAATTALVLLTAPVAAQAATTAHSPTGHLDSAKGVGHKHGLQIKGWADDPDATTTPLKILVSLDKGNARRFNSGKPRPDIQKAFPKYGPNQGFSITIYTTPGVHNVCVTAVNIGPGANTLLGCTSVTVK